MTLFLHSPPKDAGMFASSNCLQYLQRPSEESKSSHVLTSHVLLFGRKSVRFTLVSRFNFYVKRLDKRRVWGNPMTKQMCADWDTVKLSKQKLEGNPNQVTSIVIRVEGPTISILKSSSRGASQTATHVCAKHKANVFYFIYPPEIASNGDDVSGGNSDDVMPFSYCALPQLFISM
uniref:Uncharacterized protein n=1 Tax=Glossina pallidipes TaxID=7398 RepID=A0A1A9ZCH6_GLOPL